MNRKFAVILLLTVYAFSYFGIGIKQFYCCGKLKSTTISFIEQNKKTCVNGGESEGCCKTKYQVVKVRDSHILGEFISNPAKIFADIHLITPTIEITALAVESKSIANAIHAPPKRDVPIYIFNCVYRI